MYTTNQSVCMIEGVSVRELQATYGTPLYIMSEPELESRLGLVRSAFLDKYPNKMSHGRRSQEKRTTFT